ncbi:protocadherin-16-like [Lacerta agilis]|uniref:protocadherin-16-like n=1 Tax=Lacerta agilis TaxID=80427 RepID=UPI001419E3DE|nr:protocadherin-16-like [Lacerta agilis]
MEVHKRQVLSLVLYFCMRIAMCEPILYSVPEEKKSGSLVANVLKDLKVDAEELFARRAQLVSKSSKQYFHLDPHSGDLILKDKIDRESLCGQNDPCLLFSEIVLENPLQLQRIKVQIQDVNDNTPKFSKMKFIFEIPEQVPVNTRFPLERAQDSDIGENAVQNYTLSPNEHFRLDVQRHIDGSKYIELVLEKQLDREVNPQITLILSAVDGGIPKRTGTVRIIIDVLDTNDNFPQFEQSTYKVKLTENTPLETLITKVEATDRDLGSFAQLTYSFSEVPEGVLRSFNLNKNTGEITISGTIDYEENRNYDLRIKATDGGGLSAYCKVIVEIEDENDNAPEITITSITSPLPEDSPPDTVVALFSVTDVDSGDSGKTACTTEVNLPFVLKPTENNYYQLVTQQPLDREQASEYNITITATDRGSPRLTSTRILHVQISDVNDNPPVFEKPFYEMQLRENNIPGLLIDSVHAVDLDTAQNAKVTYSLLPGKVNDGPTSSYISINSETGNLYAIRSLDYEEVKDFHVTVRAVDSGSPPLSSEVTIRVQVVDENDNAPFILYPLQNGTSPSNDLVPRGAETGYLVTKVVAVDRDSAQNSWLSYQLLKATEPGLFTVGAQNGEVTTLRPVSNRDGFKQNLIVVVRDNGHPPQSTSATLRILLVDGFSDPYLKSVALPKEETAEEEDPSLTMYLIICLAAISSIFLISIVAFIVIKMQKREKFIGTYNSAANFPVGPDSQENPVDSGAGSLSQAYNYEVCLAGGSLNSEFRFLRPLFPVFSVEPPNTQVNPRSSNDSEGVPSHAGESQHILQVSVAFESLLYDFISNSLSISLHYSVPEEKKRGSLVANVLEDLKLGTGDLSVRRAQLVSKDTKQYFHLNTHSGNLLINDKIDREVLCDQTDPCLLLSQIVLENPLELYSIVVKIEDVNDNVPKFSTKEFDLEIPENVPTNTQFPLESAQDEDLGRNNIQNYKLSPNEHFRLDVKSDEDGSKYVDLVLEKPLDREKEPHFGLTLTAVDGGEPQRTGTVQINIHVLDNNDNFPQFTQSEYKTKLKENSPQGTLVFKVEATDLDFGSNAQITYSFQRVPEKIYNLFHLNEIMGEITVLGQVDFEKETRYDMKIRATDGGGLSGHCKVLVDVEDVNDNVPEVSVISITDIIQEDSPLDTVVALFSVTDRDSGDNGRTVCSVETNLPFVLKPTMDNYYQLLVQSSLDREKVSEYNITITAVDQGSPRLTSTRIINIQISDVNDNPPVFEKSSCEMQIRENNIPGLLLGSVHAADLDTEKNAKVTYSLLPGKVTDGLVASYISVNSESGNLYALQSLDYEQIKDFKVTVRATDGGSPPLSSEVTVRVVIIDENDNAPFFLYPLQNSTSPCNELVPKSVEAGYLVTKVVAVDGDSGQNSWLSYELLKATDPGLFSIGAQNGEVRTRRALTERDTSKQRLMIVVRDNGLPPQSSTAMLHVLPVGGFSDPHMKAVEVSKEEHEEDGTLTLYLVICLAAVSFVFLVCIVSFAALKICRRDPRESFIAAPPHFPPARPDIPENCGDSQSGSLSRSYHYDVCLTGGSLSSEFRFLRPLIPVFSVGDPNLNVNQTPPSASQDIPDQAVKTESRKEGPVC